MTTITDPEVKQPLHPSIIPKLDPAYVDFHRQYIQQMPPRNELQWNPVFRELKSPFALFASKPLDVGKIDEFELMVGTGGESKSDVDIAIKMKAYTPHGEPPLAGWPGLVYFHGGGWATGGLENEYFITNLCIGAKCVVLSVDYRLAPENKFPAAIEDAVDALKWMIRNGKDLLNVDTSKIATGGISAGGNIAAVLALKSAETSFAPALPRPMALQLLIVPSIDQTATDAPGGRWESNKHAPFLTPAAIKWFHDLYFRSENDAFRWEASPILAPEGLLRRAPKAWIAAGELDLLCSEAEAYAEKLNEHGVEAECVVYKGGTHTDFALDKILKNGTQGISDAVDALAKAFKAAE